MLININANAINTTSTAADVQRVTQIRDLSDVDIPNGLDNGQILVYNGSTFNWENSNTITADSVVDANLTITGETIPYTLRANPDTDNRFTFRTTWENYGTDIYDLSSSLRTYQDPDADQLAVHQWFTQNNNYWYKFEALDTGNGDDGSQLTRLTLQGSDSEITGDGQLNISNPSVFISNEITPTLIHTTANTDGQLRIRTTWPQYGTTDYDLTTRLSTFKGSAPGQLAVHQWRTENNWAWYRFEATDTGGGDDSTHNTTFTLQGNGGFIRSDNSLGLQSSSINLEADSDLTLTAPNGVFRLNSRPELLVRKNHDTTNSEVAFIRWNNTGGAVVESGSQLALNFNMISEDETTEQNIGQFQVIYDDGGQGNTYNVIVNDTLGAQVNALEIRETHTRSQQPFAYPTFTQTEINAMSPVNGWVLYNISTEKLQVYAAGSWVDLH